MNNMENKIIGIIKILFSFVIILMAIGLIYKQADIPNNSVAPEPKKSLAKEIPVPNITISNPEYLRSPGDFLVDQADLVSSDVPTDNPVWVEKVINENTIRVSYIIEKEGLKIFKIKPLAIAYLDSYKNYDNQVFRDMLNGRSYDLHVDGNSHVDCMRKLTTDVLENMIKERYVYLQLISISKGLEDPHFAVISDEIDVGQTLIKNGFGIVGTKLSGDPVYGTDYDLVEKILEAKMEGTIVHDPDFWAVTVDDGPYLQKLVGQQQLARLANVGIWSECSYAKFPLVIK